MFEAEDADGILSGLHRRLALVSVLGLGADGLDAMMRWPSSRLLDRLSALHECSPLAARKSDDEDEISDDELEGLL